jgi:hypothetical protein
MDIGQGAWGKVVNAPNKLERTAATLFKLLTKFNLV